MLGNSPAVGEELADGGGVGLTGEEGDADGEGAVAAAQARGYAAAPGLPVSISALGKAELVGREHLVERDEAMEVGEDEGLVGHCGGVPHEEAREGTGVEAPGLVRGGALLLAARDKISRGRTARR